MLQLREVDPDSWNDYFAEGRRCEERTVEHLGATRPVLVVSTDAFNAWPVGLVIVVPIATRDRGFAHHIAVAGGEQPTLAAVDDWLRRLTGR